MRSYISPQVDTIVYSDIDLSTGKIDALPDITENVFVLESSLSHSDKVKQVETWHKQFGHASTGNMKCFIDNTGEQDAGLMKIIDEVFNKHVMTVETQGTCTKTNCGIVKS